MSKIKNFLKHFLPATYNTFNSRFDEVFKKIKKLEGDSQKHFRTLDETYKKGNENISSELKELNKKIEEKQAFVIEKVQHLNELELRVSSELKVLSDTVVKMATGCAGLTEETLNMHIEQNPVLKDTLEKFVQKNFKTIWSKYRTNSVVMPYTELKADHIEDMKCFLNREELIQSFPKSSICAEIGVASGEFSQFIFNTLKPVKFHLIDMWGTERYGQECEKKVHQRFNNEISEGKVVINYGKSIDVLKNISDGYFDWVYIDSDHSYKTTRDELELCRLKVRKGGIISGHDFVLGYWMGGLKYGVIEAVCEFCKKYNWKFYGISMETHGGRHSSFAIQEIQ